MLRLFRKRNKQRLIAVDISSTSVKILELSKKNKGYQVESYGISPLAEGCVVDKNILDPDAVTEALCNAMDMANPQTVNAVTAIPMTMVIYKTVAIDAAIPEQRREEQLRINAKQYIPFALDEVSLDFVMLPNTQDDQAQINVFLAATRTTYVDARVDILAQAGLHAHVVDIERCALERAYSLLTVQLPLHVQTVAILDLGHCCTTLTVLQRGKIQYSREYPFGGQQLIQRIQDCYGLSHADADHALRRQTLSQAYYSEILPDFFRTIVQHSKHALQSCLTSTGIQQIDHMVLSGGYANLGGLLDYLQQKLAYPILIANPFARMCFAAQIDQKQLNNDAPALLVACGLALWGDQ